MKKIEIILLLLFLMIIGLYLTGKYNLAKDNRQAQRVLIDKQKKLDSGEYERILISSPDQFDRLANDYITTDTGRFCRMGNSQYRVNGDEFDFTNNRFFEWHGPLGGYNKTYEELLKTQHLTAEQFDGYKKFLDTYQFIDCINSDINLKSDDSIKIGPNPEDIKVTAKREAVRIEVTNYEGFIYVTDGSITENVNQGYKNNTYSSLERVANTNWFKFKYKTEYGI